MPPEGRDPSDPRSWLRRARSNLARARIGRSSPEILLEDSCFDAQQAAEKAIKAVWVSQHAESPLTLNREILDRDPVLAEIARRSVASPDDDPRPQRPITPAHAP